MVLVVSVSLVQLLNVAPLLSVGILSVLPLEPVAQHSIVLQVSELLGVGASYRVHNRFGTHTSA